MIFFLSQRVLEEKSNHKDIFINGNNSISIKIKDKKTQEFIKNSIVSFRISRPTNHNNTMDFENKDFKMIDNAYVLNTKLPLKGNWNITATFKIGNDVGYLYIKSNAI